jgi:YfiH family protein
MDLRLTTVPDFSACPGLVHGFEQRETRGGTETRKESRDRVQAALREAGRVHFLQQVHGAIVLQAPWVGTPEGDAALAVEPGLLLGIETADCLPVLIVDPERRTASAAHAGWRGTAASVVSKTVEALTAAGSRPEDLLVALGPAIGPCCYEVGDELRSSFGPAADSFFKPGPRGRPHLDVRALNVHQLRECGVPSDRIHSVDECTSCRPDLYFSYRRDGPATGRMISFIGWSSPSPEGP